MQFQSFDREGRLIREWNSPPWLTRIEKGVEILIDKVDFALAHAMGFVLNLIDLLFPIVRRH